MVGDVGWFLGCVYYFFFVFLVFSVLFELVGVVL